MRTVCRVENKNFVSPLFHFHYNGLRSMPVLEHSQTHALRYWTPLVGSFLFYQNALEWPCGSTRRLNTAFRTSTRTACTDTIAVSAKEISWMDTPHSFVDSRPENSEIVCVRKCSVRRRSATAGGGENRLERQLPGRCRHLCCTQIYPHSHSRSLSTK